jgi:hypothetical protein
MLSPALLEELRTILEEEYAFHGSDDELQQIGQGLVGLFTVLCQIDRRKGAATTAPAPEWRSDLGPEQTAPHP